MAEKSSKIFLDFMSRIAKLEELVAIGSRLLVGFQQELEFFRRPPLHEASKVAASIIEANPTERLKAYVEAGCKHVPVAVQNTIKLNACLQGLRDYISKAKELIDELKYLGDDATGVAEATNQEFQQFLGNISGDGSAHHANCFEEKDTKTGCQQILQASNHAITMRTIYNMVKLDYEMQERIVESLDHSTPSEQLESYCLMWDLRPFIDDNTMHRAWKYIP